MDEIRRTTGINPELEAYEGFFDCEWHTHFLETVRRSILREPGFDLVRNWEAISNARQLPWVMTRSVDIVSRESMEKFVPWDQKKIRIMRERLVTKLEARGHTLRPTLRKDLTQALKELDEETGRMCDNVATRVLEERGTCWAGLTNIRAFHTSLWALERMCYGGLYYGYECFVMRCMSMACKDPNYQMPKRKDFIKQLRDVFGDKTTDDCWLDSEIDLARVTRNALVHNGGKVTSHVKKRKHTFRIEDGEIQINAVHTTNLYQKLKDRVTQLAKVAVVLPEFAESPSS